MRNIKSLGLFSAGLLAGLFLHGIGSPSPFAWARGGDGGSAGSALVGGGCDGDIAPSPNGDGIVGVPDLLFVINNWGPCPIPEDLDRDGYTVAEGDCADNNPNINPGMPELCNGIDDNCNGDTDEGQGGQTCIVGVGACQVEGITVCDGKNGMICFADPGTPKPETCNGIDDDCNGFIDDGLGLGQPCFAGIGACSAEGTIICDGNGGTMCSAIPGTPSTEVCDNGIDDDCNGLVDEGCP